MLKTFGITVLNLYHYPQISYPLKIGRDNICYCGINCIQIDDSSIVIEIVRKQLAGGQGFEPR